MRTFAEISIEEATEIASSAGDEIRIFADSLIWKRLREVEKFLPITRRVLGDKFEELFRKHAEGFNPTTVKKHYEDAMELGHFLQQSNSVEHLVENVVKFETAKLSHFVEGRRVTVCLLRYDLRPIFGSLREEDDANLKKRRSIVLWLTLKERTRFFFI